jgi:hypothetical protein
MTLRNFLKNYGFNACITIDENKYKSDRKVYCEEAVFSGDDKERLIKNKLGCWNEIKDRQIKKWNIIGGGGYYPVELCIELEPIEKREVKEHEGVG